MNVEIPKEEAVQKIIRIGHACHNNEFPLLERSRRVDELLSQTAPEVHDWFFQTVNGRKPPTRRLLALLSANEAKIRGALAENNPPQVEIRVERKPSAVEIQLRVRNLAERERKKREHERGKIPLRSSYNK